MGEPRVWWRAPGEDRVCTLRFDPQGEAHFHFGPFAAVDGAPLCAWRGVVEEAEWPEPGTLGVAGAGGMDRVDRTRRGEHEAAIAEGLKRIASGELDKVVLARVEFVPASEALPPEEVFRAKCADHPDAFVYLVAHPVCGVWLGATPELLLKSDGATCETVSLAATRRAADRDHWTDKERAEQAVVTRYIADVLREAGAESVHVTEAIDRIYGPLAHLESRIRFAFAGALPDLVRRLHPTPAVGGSPLAAALSLIARLERLPRRYYAGFLGVTLPTSSRFYVNLRCMEWVAGGVLLHAGGGIVAGSDPASEWEETEAKLAAIRMRLVK
jgi:isochorismate synthase